MKYTGKFDVLVEEYIDRYRQSGFLSGDYVKIRPDALSNDKLKALGENVKDRIKTAMQSDLYLKVGAVKAERATNSEIVGGPDAPTGHWADVVTEYAPGLWKDAITLPVEVLELVEIDGSNMAPPAPESLKRPNEDGGTTQAQAMNPMSNTKLDHTPTATDASAGTRVAG